MLLGPAQSVTGTGLRHVVRWSSLGPYTSPYWVRSPLHLLTAAFGTELPTFALQRFRLESGDQLTLAGSDPEDRS